MKALVRRPDKGRLRGSAIFLSASVPKSERAAAFRRLADAQREIEQAVVSLARAVFAEGGRLVFGGHPSISPLVSLVAGEYVSAGRAEPREGSRNAQERRADLSQTAPVIIHQLDAFRSELPDATTHMEELGQAVIRWHETLPDERRVEWPASAPRYPKSLRRMRLAMLGDKPSFGERLRAMVCLGGMEGVFEEAALFHELRHQPVYVLARTGGASELLARRDTVREVSVPDVPIVSIDEAVLQDVRPQLRGQDGESYDAPPRFAPYPVIMDALLRRVAEGQ